jgi:hypothetical protein
MLLFKLAVFFMLLFKLAVFFMLLFKLAVFFMLSDRSEGTNSLPEAYSLPKRSSPF